MDMKTYLRQAPQPDRESLASVVGSSVAYFYQIAGGHKKPGVDLCKALIAAEPKLTLHELRPDVWSADMDSIPTDQSRRSTDPEPDPAPTRGGRQPQSAAKMMSADVSQAPVFVRKSAA